MKIYLAARYSRREELCDYRRQLQDMGHEVQCRWLDGPKQISDTGIPIGEAGEALIEGSGAEAAILRAGMAQDDWEDVVGAEVVINFTETPRSTPNRGGRHVEFGIALAGGARVLVVGHRENIFHWLPTVEFHETWEKALESL